jgi:hypothetical protein
MCCCTIILLLPLYNNTAIAILTWFHKNSLVFTGFCYWHTDLVSQKKPSCLDVTWGRNIGKSIHSQVLFISQLVSRHQVLLKSENWFLSGQNWWWSCVSKPQKLDQKNVGKYSFWLLLCTFVYFFQATPRLSEDKVKQCVDPRLKGEYPPKGVAKVDILPPGTCLCVWCFTLIWSSFYWCNPWTLPAACCSGSSMRAIWSRVQAQHEHSCEGAFASPSTKTCTSHRRASPATCELKPVTCDGTLGIYSISTFYESLRVFWIFVL